MLGDLSDQPAATAKTDGSGNGQLAGSLHDHVRGSR